MQRFFKKIILRVIKIYQKTLSPDHGFLSFLFPFGVCRFYPSCSQYCYEAIKKYGFYKGFLMGIKRIYKCRPCHDCEYDPVK